MGFLIKSLTRFALGNSYSELCLLSGRRFFASTEKNITIKSKPSPKSEELIESKNEDKLQRSLRIAVIGVPNAGKSTFINNLINHRICPTSSKVHTTRSANKAICTTDDVQLVFIDTPGLVTETEIKRHHLEKSFVSACRYAVQNSDIIAVIHDISNSYTRNELHSTVLDTLTFYPNKSSILILNKIDALKSKRILLDSIRCLTNGSIKSDRIFQKYGKDPKNKVTKERTKNSGWQNFEDVFMVSSITGNGLTDVKKYLSHNAQIRPWSYKADCTTDELPGNVVVNSVRARLLDYLPQEIPYNLQSELEYFSEENGTICTSVIVTCPSPRIEKLICGQSNGRLYQITERVSSDLVETFRKPISLTIATKTKLKI